jgi:pre-rRNA-processing protein TSR3
VFPPTIIVVHPKEKRRKCTVEPLRGKEGFVFWKFPHLGPESLDGYVRLGFDGPQLSRADADRGLLILDGTWRLTQAMEPAFGHVPPRSLPPWKTAYPRLSKMFQNPEGGLATIEAVFAAHQILGRNTAGILDGYHWAADFLKLNGQTP